MYKALVLLVNVLTLANNKELLIQLEELKAKQCDVSIILTDYNISLMEIPELAYNPCFILKEPLLPSELTHAIESVIDEKKSNKDNKSAEPQLTTSIKESKNKDKDTSTTEHKEDFKQAKILLVEDNKVNQMVAKALLNRLNLNVDVANNGAEAVDFVNKQKIGKDNYQLILMDIQMPVMDGLEATQMIRQHQSEYHQNIPIIALTAHVMEKERIRCQQAGMNDFITKPINPEFLSTTLKKWLN